MNMALITCPECGEEISSFAEVCVHCGFPMNKYKYLEKQAIDNCVADEVIQVDKFNIDPSIIQETSAISAKEAIKQIMNIRGETNVSFANKLGVSPQALWDRLNNKKSKSPTIAILNLMARALGYRIILAPIVKELPEGTILIDE